MISISHVETANGKGLEEPRITTQADGTKSKSRRNPAICHPNLEFKDEYFFKPGENKITLDANNSYGPMVIVITPFFCSIN